MREIKDQFDTQSNIALRVAPIVTFTKVLADTYSTVKLRCITAHSGVQRNRTKRITSFIPKSFKEGDIIERCKAVIKPDFWVLATKQ